MTQIALHTRFEDITEAQWDELLVHSADATVFQSRAWLTAWWECFQQPHWTLQLLTAQQHGRLVALAPLYSRPGRFGAQELRLLGEGHSDYLLFVARRGAEQAVDDLLQAMAVTINEGSNALLTDVPETSLLHRALQRRIAAGGSDAQLSLHCVDRTPCPRLTLAGNQAGIAALLRKQSLRRHLRSLASVGPVDIVHHTDAANILSALPQLFAMHRARWQDSATPASSSTPRHRPRPERATQARNGNVPKVTSRHSRAP
jgi:CelD/BcsL family acetyltransferase involved in cellulose biosynthesis